MPIQRVQTPTEVAKRTQVVVLEGQKYELTYRFDFRLGRWTMNTAEVGGAPLVLGSLMKPNWPMYFHESNPALPQGDLMIVNFSGATQQYPGREDLGESFRMYYQPSDEIPEPIADSEIRSIEKVP